MKWTELPTHYTDAVWAGLKKYRLINNPDGTVSFQDVTVYTNKETSFFGAKDANQMNKAMNTLVHMGENGEFNGKNATINGVEAITIEASGGLIGKMVGSKFIIESKDGGISNAGAHNSIFRGKNLGTSVSVEHYKAIANGTFDDLYIGDYWTIGGVNYRIAAFDYYLNTGDVACTKHHAVIVPDTLLYSHSMNDTNTTDGGYVGSKMYESGLEQAKSTIKNAFTNHVLSHRLHLVNAVSNGCASASLWADSEVDLMTEQMAYGCSVLLPVGNGGEPPVNYRIDKSQLPLFMFRPDLISNQQSYWLRDVISTRYFAYVAKSGHTSCDSASSSNGVRPVFLIS